MRLLNEASQSVTPTHGSDQVPAPVPVKLVVTPATDPVVTKKSAEREEIERLDANNRIPSWDPFDRSCLSRDLFDTIGDKWAMLILLSIQDGPLRNGEIREKVQGISPKVLTQRLGVLVEDGLVTRTSHHQIPPRVDYELTELGETVIEPLQSVYEWTVSHMDEVMDVRRKTRKRQTRAS